LADNTCDRAITSCVAKAHSIISEHIRKMLRLYPSISGMMCGFNAGCIRYHPHISRKRNSVF
jgi:hypothetical protein